MLPDTRKALDGIDVGTLQLELTVSDIVLISTHKRKYDDFIDSECLSGRQTLTERGLNLQTYNKYLGIAVHILLALCVAVLGIRSVFAQAKPAAPPQPAQKTAAPVGIAEPKSGEDLAIGTLHVTVWRPTAASVHPLVIFSHALHGSSRQSTFLMKALADHGFLVIAPNHKDAQPFGKLNAGITPPPQTFARSVRWNDSTYKDRANDIRGLVKKLKSDADWSKQIDWSKVALIGHSLGGYTVLGLAGAYGSWYLPEAKAVIALSPYCAPFVAAKTLIRISMPVMYQGGTMDFAVTPTVKNKGGAFDQTPAPVVFVDFARAAHFAWTDGNPAFQTDISSYCIAFLDKYLKGEQPADLLTKTTHVAELRNK